MTISPAALVTGAGIRIGRAIALDLARNGHAVAVHYNGSAGQAEQAVAEIRAAGGKAEAVQADLADAAQVASLVPRAAAAVGPLTLLVNNASIFEYDAVASTTLAGWDLQLDINLRRRSSCLRPSPRSCRSGRGGRRGSVVVPRPAGVEASPYFVSYTVSKTGLWTLTQTVAMALAPRIRVKRHRPGPDPADVHQKPGQFEQQLATTPLRRGPSLEVAATVRHLLAARSMTGQMIALDGGRRPSVDGGTQNLDG
jgi:NAD(P)-dependent dehydrogenase (short-subunit alcohol dehydrogenase family)